MVLSRLDHELQAKSLTPDMVWSFVTGTTPAFDLGLAVNTIEIYRSQGLVEGQKILQLLVSMRESVKEPKLR